MLVVVWAGGGAKCCARDISGVFGGCNRGYIARCWYCQWCLSDVVVLATTTVVVVVVAVVVVVVVVVVVGGAMFELFNCERNIKFVLTMLFCCMR